MKKNVIYIHTHDSGKVLSPYGYDVPTPSLQKFAEDATIFRQAYCVGPTCSPSRAGLLTGMYPHSNGMYGLSQRGFKLHDYNQHLVNFLKKKIILPCYVAFSMRLAVISITIKVRK